MFNETARSFFVSVSCHALLLVLLSGLYRVHGLRVSSLCTVVRRPFLPILCFRKVVCFLCLSLFSSTMRSFFSFSFLSLAYWPFRARLLACLIWAALWHLSAFVYIPMLCPD